MQALYVLFGALFTVAVSMAIGRTWLRRTALVLTRMEEALLGLVLGSAVLSGAIFVLMALRLAYKGVFLVLGATALLAAFKTGAKTGEYQAPPPLPRYLRWTFGAPFAFFTVFYLLNAMAPEFSADGATYHLSFVARYLRQHGFVTIPYNMYGQLSQGVEMLFAFAFSFGRHSAAALVHFSFLVALTLLILCYGRRIGYPSAGVAAALMFYVSPVVGMDGTSAYVDVATACVLFALFYLVQIWEAQRYTRLLAAAGLLAGFAFAAKYTAFLAVPYAAGYVLWRTRRIRPAALVVACSLIPIAPWIGKNLLVTGNPVSPMMNRWFPNSYVHASFERDWSHSMREYGVSTRWEIPWQLTTRGTKVAGQIGPWFLLIPLALAGLRTKEGRALLVPALLYTAPYFSNIGARFFIAPLPFWSLAIAVVLAAYPRALMALGLIAAVLGWPAVTSLYAGPYGWRMEPKFPLKAALRIESEDRYLARKHPEYPITRVIEAKTPAGARILAFNGRPEAYTTRDYAVYFQSARGETLGDIFFSGFLGDYQPRLRQSFAFPSQKVERLRVVQAGNAAKPEEEWEVNEIRLFSKGKQIPRSSEWRLTARPNPWDVQLAFDNSPVTRWRAWDSLKDGSYIEIALLQPVTVDEVAVEGGYAQAAVKLRVEVPDGHGGWRAIATEKTQTELPSPGFQGPAALGEIKARGFDYILVAPGEWDKELAQAPEAWGVTEVGRAGATVLYRIDVPGPSFAEPGSK